METRTVERLEDIPTPLPDADFVVVDVVTASTSIIELLDSGASYVRPFAGIDAARTFGQREPEALLVGEDGGDPLDGFDHVPLPTRLRTLDLTNRPVGIRTSNGTRAIDQIGDGEIFVGSTVNASALASTLAERHRDTWLVAAGYGGVPTPEDTAGVELIRAHMNGGPTSDLLDNLRADIKDSPPAAWLEDIGLGDDIDRVLQFDSTDTVPRLEDGVFVAEE